MGRLKWVEEGWGGEGLLPSVFMRVFVLYFSIFSI